jgi:hypothetical protein
MAGFALLFLSVPASAAPSVTTLYSFTDGSDGAFPCSGVVADSNGALYGFTLTGTIFRLAPPIAGSTWTFSILYTMPRNSFLYSCVPPVFDSSGSLYGVQQPTLKSRSFVFKLLPPPGGGVPWQMSVVRVLRDSKTPSNGADPSALMWDAQIGALIGTTQMGGDATCAGEGGSIGCGMVYMLSPPAVGTEWGEQILHSFHARGDGECPGGPMALGSDGTLFGATICNDSREWGTLYSLTPPAAGSSPWTFKVLHTLRPDGISDLDGVLFNEDEKRLYVSSLAGPGSGAGAFGYFYTPASGVDRLKLLVVHYFTSGGLVEPNGYMALGPSRAVYGTVYSDGGGIFKFTPPSAATSDWQYEALASGTTPVGALVVTRSGTVFAASEFGGTQSGSVCNSAAHCGAIIRVSP